MSIVAYALIQCWFAACGRTGQFGMVVLQLVRTPIFTLTASYPGHHDQWVEIAHRPKCSVTCAWKRDQVKM